MDKLTSAQASAKTTRGVAMPPCGVGRADGGSNAGPAAEAATGLGVYVHFPWCIKKCPYCDFLSVPAARSEIPHRAYADAVVREIETRRAELGPGPIRSIFLGGGTPSLWAPAELGRVLAAIRDAWGEAPEVTVECNPGSTSFDSARALLDVGVNRLSVGVQALDAERLRFLGRWHSAEQAIAALRAALAAGVPRVSADLIFGVHGQSPAEAAAEVRELAELGLHHVSAYALTIEPQTAFGALARKGRLPQAPEAAVAEAFEAVDAALVSLDFEHYEISNFARAGQRAEHNLGYWRGLDYVGLGCGAWGTVTRSEGPVRYRNRPQPLAYLEIATALSPAVSGAARALESESEPLSPEVRMSEALMLGLRLADGVDVEAAARRTGASWWTPARRSAVSRLISRGQLAQEGSRLSIPKPAWLFSDGIIGQLI